MEPTGVKEPGQPFVRATKSNGVPSLFGPPEPRGERFDLDGLDATEYPVKVYNHPSGNLWIGDASNWLSTLPDGSVDLIVADPPYNIKKAEWDTFESQQAYVEWSLGWIKEAARVLSDAGTLYVCRFPEILADLRLPASQFFKGCRWLVWHYKNKANLRNDWGRSHEGILHFRKGKKYTFNTDDVRIPYGAHTLKYPAHPQAESSQYGGGKKEKTSGVLIQKGRSLKM